MGKGTAHRLGVTALLVDGAAAKLSRVVEPPAVHLAIRGNCDRVLGRQRDARPTHRTFDRRWLEDGTSRHHPELPYPIVPCTERCGFRTRLPWCLSVPRNGQKRAVAQNRCAQLRGAQASCSAAHVAVGAHRTQRHSLLCACSGAASLATHTCSPSPARTPPGQRMVVRSRVMLAHIKDLQRCRHHEQRRCLSGWP